MDTILIQLCHTSRIKWD